MELNTATLEPRPSIFPLTGEEVILAPIGDIQHGAVGGDLDKAKRHIDMVMEMGGYFISMGDLVDGVSPSNRVKIAHAELYDTPMNELTEAAHKRMEEVYAALKGTEGRWLGFHEGHHYWVFGINPTTGAPITTDTLIADKMSAPYLGWEAITTISFPNTRLTAQVLSTHGEGASATLAGPLNKLEKQMSRYPEADILLMGHYSRKVGYPVDALAPDGKGKLHAKRRILAVTGGFARGYLVGTTTYVERALMPPTNLGAPIIFIRPEKTRIDMNIYT